MRKKQCRIIEDRCTGSVIWQLFLEVVASVFECHCERSVAIP
jgi:hypothetical protein